VPRTLRRDNKTATFGSAAVDRLDDVNQLKSLSVNIPIVQNNEIVTSTNLLLIVHSPVSARINITFMRRISWKRRKTHILLLLPVPKSIMICLLLSCVLRVPEIVPNMLRAYLPVEEHNSAWIVQFVHLDK
jgi:hypothetical protein